MSQGSDRTELTWAHESRMPYGWVPRRRKGLTPTSRYCQDPPGSGLICGQGAGGSGSRLRLAYPRHDRQCVQRVNDHACDSHKHTVWSIFFNVTHMSDSKLDQVIK